MINFNDPEVLKLQRVIRINEAAVLLNRNVKDVRKLMANGSLPSFLVGRERKTSYLAVLQYIDNLTSGGPEKSMV